MKNQQALTLCLLFALAPWHGSAKMSENSPALALPRFSVLEDKENGAQNEVGPEEKVSTPTSVAPAALATTKAPESISRETASSITDAAYKIHPGDILKISVWKEEQLDQDVTVLPDGTVDFPLVGSFTAQGLTTTEVQKLVKAKLTSTVPYAAVTVTVKEAKGNAISVIGQVQRPGEVVMARNLTVMQALSQVGGLTTYADEDDIKILRKVDGKETAIAFDYSDVSRGDDLETNITLQPGDVIVVPAASLF